MKAIKGIYEKGKVKLSEELDEKGPLEVLVVFPVEEDDPWEAILNEKTLRPAFQKFVEQCEEEIRQGKAKPLKLEDL